MSPLECLPLACSSACFGGTLAPEKDPSIKSCSPCHLQRPASYSPSRHLHSRLVFVGFMQRLSANGLALKVVAICGKANSLFKSMICHAVNGP